MFLSIFYKIYLLWCFVCFHNYKIISFSIPQSLNACWS